MSVVCGKVGGANTAAASAHGKAGGDGEHGGDAKRDPGRGGAPGERHRRVS